MSDRTATATCSIEGCERIRTTRGWCNPHYQRWVRWGDPLMDRRRRVQSCSQIDCDAHVRGRGLCNKHYIRLRDHGDPAVTPSRSLPVEARFQLYITVAPNGCWEWISTIDKDGYGDFWYQGDSVGAHRVAWALWRNNGELLSLPLSLDHECHNADPSCPGGTTCRHRRCVNPEHLVVRTIADNVRARLRFDRAAATDVLRPVL